MVGAKKKIEKINQIDEQDAEGKSYFKCKRCTLSMIRSYKNRRHDNIEITIPKGLARMRS